MKENNTSQTFVIKAVVQNSNDIRGHFRTRKKYRLSWSYRRCTRMNSNWSLMLSAMGSVRLWTSPKNRSLVANLTHLYPTAIKRYIMLDSPRYSISIQMLSKIYYLHRSCILTLYYCSKGLTTSCLQVWFVSSTTWT